MKELKYTSKSVTVFFAVTIIISAIVETAICMNGPGWLYLLLMWTPAAAALAANCVLFAESKEKLSVKKLLAYGGFKRCKLKYILLGCILPFIYISVPYMIFWRIYPQSFAYNTVPVRTVLKDLTLPLTMGIFISLLSAIGEEIGWRGFMVPALYERLGLNKTLIISSLFWCGWHLPLLIGGGYMTGTPLWYQLCAFVLCIFPVGVIIGIITIKSGSVWPAAFLHAAHNNYDQMVFDVITFAENKMYFVSETGIFTIICAWVLAAIMYFKVIKKSEIVK